TPMLITTFISRGTWKGFVYSRSFMSAGITAVRKRSRIRGGTPPLTLARLAPHGRARARPARLGRARRRQEPCRPVPPSGPSGTLETCRPSFRPPLRSRLVDDFAGFAGDTHFLAVAQRAHANPG